MSLARAVILAFCFVGCVPLTPAQDTVRNTLPPGRVVERNFRAESSHTYQIWLEAGHFLEVEVIQLGVDVKVSVVAPKGQVVAEVDGINGSLGLEPTLWVAPAPGLYQIVIKPLEEKARRLGSYTIRLAAPRPAQPTDLARAQAQNLTGQASKLQEDEKYPAAVALLKQAVSLQQNLAKPAPPELALTLHHLAATLEDAEDLAQAESYYRQALEVQTQRAGPESADLAEMSKNLADLCYEKDAYAPAIQFYQRALQLFEKWLGPEHPEVATTLYGLALAYEADDQATQAEPLYERALAIREKVFGPQDATVAEVLSDFADYYYQHTEQYEKAVTFYVRAIAINETVYGPASKEVGVIWHDLALVYEVKKDYAQAETGYRKSLAIKEKTFGMESLEVADVVYDLGDMYQTRGDYAQAELWYQRALAIRVKDAGPETLPVATVLNDLGTVAHRKGDYRRAEELLQKALAIRENLLPPNHGLIANSLNNLGFMYYRKGDYPRAEAFLLRALQINEAKYGPASPNIATELDNLGKTYSNLGDNAKAEAFYRRALAIREKSGNERDIAITRNNLALLLEDYGNYAEAETLLLKSLASDEKTLGLRHPILAIPLSNLSYLYINKGALAQALAFRARALEVEEYNLKLILATGSEKQKQLYLKEIAGSINAVISLHLHSLPESAEAAWLALTTILQRKGRALDAMTDQIASLRRQAAPADQLLLNQLETARTRLATLQLSGAGGPALAESQKLESEIERLENEVSRRSAELGALVRPVTLDAVQRELPADAALIEFIAYRGPKGWHYAAYLLRPDQPNPQALDLGLAKSIDDSVERWREALRDPNRKDTNTLARELDEKLMRPVRRLLGPQRRLLLSPDHILNLIPFAALVDENGKYLIESYELSYLTSGRDVLRPSAAKSGNMSATVFADPLFDLKPGRAKCDNGPRGRAFAQAQRRAVNSARNLDFTDFCYSPLDGTAQEATGLRQLLPQAQVLTQAQATEATLKQLRHPRLLHIATHGFFLSQEDFRDAPAEPSRSLDISTPDDKADGKRRLRRPQSDSFQLPDNPLLRSGLVLAGVKQRRSGPANDGVMTALEVAGLDLYGTELVVLSACETALGTVSNGDGVYGLRRALVLAGSETQVMSLWQVSDRATRALMLSYYKLLLAGAGRAAALRQVQLAMLRGTDMGGGNAKAKKAMSLNRKHPYYWAAFIPSGAWTTLDGKEPQ